MICPWLAAPGPPAFDVTVNQLKYHEPVTVGGAGEPLGVGLGEALGDPLGEALGEALGEPEGDADGVGLFDRSPAKTLRSINKQNCVCCPLQFGVNNSCWGVRTNGCEGYLIGGLPAGWAVRNCISAACGPVCPGV